MKGKLHMRKRKNERAPVNALVKLDPKADARLIKSLNGIMAVTHSKSYCGTIKAVINTYAAAHLARIKMDKEMSK